MKIAYTSINRYLIILNSILFLAYWIIMILYYGDLPDRIPVQFDFSGEATGFSEKSIGTWFAVPVIITLSGLHTFIIFSALFSAGIESWKFPMKKQILALPHDDRHIYLKKVQWFSSHLFQITILYLILTALSAGIYTYFYVTGSGTFSISALLIIFTFLYLAYIIWHYVNLKRTFESQLS